MKRAVPILAMLMLAAGCDSAPQHPQVTVEDAVVTVPAVPGGAGAGYFTLQTNVGPVRLEEISSDRAGRVELHETVTENGRARMQALTDATFSPGEPLRFEPGGKHAMLFDLDQALKPGDRIRLSFRFDQAEPAQVEAEVRAPGAAHAGH